ncbi:hypothetical protein EYR40_009834 [Pleurotus pulmonarius]|nr:hypothetical protein EYR40_009834 [Pleurotus pulmonarius]
MSDAYPGSLDDVTAQMAYSNYFKIASLSMIQLFRSFSCSSSSPFLSPVAILFYDFSLTLGTESKRFWEYPVWSSAAVLFYLNRYVGLSGHIVIAFFFLKPDFLVNTNAPKSCSKFELFSELHVALIHIIISGILIIRTSALYNNDRRIKYGLCFLLFLMIVNGLVQWCIRTSKGPHGSPVNQAVVENSPLKRNCYIPYGHQQSIGCIYFALLLISNVPNILVILLSPPYLKNLLPMFVNALSSTAMSRLMLNLRDPLLRGSQETPRAITPVVDQSRAKGENDLEGGSSGDT